MNEIICDFCNFECDPDWNFCIFCGERLKDIEPMERKVVEIDVEKIMKHLESNGIGYHQSKGSISKEA